MILRRAVIKELCEDNPVVKQLINIGAIAKGIYDANTIIQVLLFYKNFVLELEREQNDEHWTLCEMEQWLLDKANASLITSANSVHFSSSLMPELLSTVSSSAILPVKSE